MTLVTLAEALLTESLVILTKAVLETLVTLAEALLTNQDPSDAN